MYIKVLAVFGFVAVAFAADLNVGINGGRIIFEQNVTASPAIWKQTQNLTVTASKSDEVISRVVVLDNRPEKDGEAKVVDGGDGHKNVTIELQGPAVFRGFDFSIQVFAIEENRYAPAPSNPTSTGHAGQNPQVQLPKDIHLNYPSKQVPKKENGDGVVLGAPKPTAASTTEAAKANNENHDKINNPALAGKEQTRLNRDTEVQKTKELSHFPVDLATGAVEASKNIKGNEKTKKPALEDHDEDYKKVIDSIFAENSMQKTQNSKPIDDKVQPVVPQVAETGDDKRKARETKKDSVVPALPKELTGDEKHTTPKTELSSSTAKNIGQEKYGPRVVPVSTESTTRNIGQEKYGPGVVPVSTESFSTAYAGKLTTESSKLPENFKTTQDLQQNIKGHHFEHHPAVPLPYHNH